MSHDLDLQVADDSLFCRMGYHQALRDVTAAIDAMMATTTYSGVDLENEKRVWLKRVKGKIVDLSRKEEPKP